MIKSNFGRKDVFCLILCMLTFSLNAQKDWKKAAVVSSSGDTLGGEILYGDWDRSPASVLFRAKEAASVKSFSPDSIRGFVLPDPKSEFVSKPIAIKYYAKTPIDQRKNPVVSEFNGNAFLEVFLRSESVILYSYKDNEKDERFFIEKNNQLTELLNIEYTTSIDGTSFRVSRPYYRSQLKQILAECPSLNTTRLNYNTKDILSLLNTYHSFCRINYQIVFEQKNSHDLFYYGITLGASPKDYPFQFAFDLQILSRNKFNNRFIIFELGRATVRDGYYSDSNQSGQLYFGLYAGTYFGLRSLRPCVFSGFSTTNGFLDTGGGIAYKKKLTLTISTGLINSSILTSQGTYSIKLRAFF